MVAMPIKSFRRAKERKKAERHRRPKLSVSFIVMLAQSALINVAAGEKSH